MSSWPVQDAKSRFSEFLDASVKKGPQVVTRSGVETAVLVPIEEWRRLQKALSLALKQLLLAPCSSFRAFRFLLAINCGVGLFRSSK